MHLFHLYKKFEFWLLRRLGLIKFGSLGKGCEIKYGLFGDAHNIFFGDHIYIGEDCNFWALGGITVGSGCIFAPNVIIRSSNHDYKTGDYIPFGPGVEKKPVIIGENCWIGANVLISPGAVIGEGCIVGFGSVVSGNIPPLSIVVGNPAKVIKQRDINLYNLAKSEGRIFFNHFKNS